MVYLGNNQALNCQIKKVKEKLLEAIYFDWGRNQSK